MGKERIVWLDIVRVLACCFVILMHSPFPTESKYGFLLVLDSYFTAPCIGLFFMVSGALLLPIKETSAFDFLRKRFSKILLPTIIWSLFYLLVKFFEGDLTFIQILDKIPSMLFSAQGHGILWFMYTLMGLYLVAPILSTWLKSCSKKEMEFYLLIWGISLCYPALRYVFAINETNTGLLYYFSGYVGYFVLGHYLMKYGKLIKMKFIMFCVFFFSVLPPLVVFVMKIKVELSSLFWYLSISVVTMCVAWFRLIQEVKLQKETFLYKGITKISSYSFGIYLVHIFIMRSLLWKMSWLTNLPPYFEIPVCSILTLSISYLVCFLIHKLPFSKYIISY